MTTTLHELPADFEATRATLQAYARAASAIPRLHADQHEKWWHAAVTVTDNGLVSDPFDLADGGHASILLDLTNHEVKFATTVGDFRVYSMAAGMTGNEMAEALLAHGRDLGLDGDYDRSKFESDEPRVYEPEVARGFLTTLHGVHGVMTQHRANLISHVGEDRVGRINLWPHGFDLAFEYFGTKMVEAEEHGELQSFPTQLNFGWYPAGDAYFYSNPWPFDADALLDEQLPGGATWVTSPFEGSTLDYGSVAGNVNGADMVLAYGARVFEAAAATLD